MLSGRLLGETNMKRPLFALSTLASAISLCIASSFSSRSLSVCGR